ELMRAILDLKDQHADLQLQTAAAADAVRTLRSETNSRHQENRREFKKLHSGISNSNAGVKRLESEVVAVKGDMRVVKADVVIMKPVVRRLRARELVRRALVQCVARWRTLFIAAGVTIGGTIAWLNDTWPK